MADPGRGHGRRRRRPRRSTPSRWSASCGSPAACGRRAGLSRSGTRLAIGEPPDDRIRAHADPVESAEEAGLRYVTDAEPRHPAPARRARVQLHRSRRQARHRHGPAWPGSAALAIPPAWTDVWICPRAAATSRPPGATRAAASSTATTPLARGARRGQVRPHDRLRPGAARASGAASTRDLRRPGLPREKVLAAVVRLLETTLIRVGNEEYARENRSLRPDHAARPPRRGRRRPRSAFEFRGKSGKAHDVELSRRAPGPDRRALPGPSRAGAVPVPGRRRRASHAIGSSDVNDYLREITGEDFTAKDFRTWAGTVLAAMALQELQSVDSEAQAQAQRGAGGRAGGRAARQHAGRRPASATSTPAVIDAYLDGDAGAGRAADGGQEAARGPATPARRRRPPCWRCSASVCARRSAARALGGVEPPRARW